VKGEQMLRASKVLLACFALAAVAVAGFLAGCESDVTVSLSSLPGSMSERFEKNHRVSKIFIDSL
jgi:hypothetical protein